MKMAAYQSPSLSLRNGGKIQMDSKFRDDFSLLDVLYANQFEEQCIDAKDIQQVEINFYRGAPPQWLNFHPAETTPLIKRDGYKELVHQIKEKRSCNVSTVLLQHTPGSGGTTLAMQVLWDLRKDLRSAALTGSTSDSRAIAKEVIRLFTAGTQGHLNTVLLLLDNAEISESLKHSITAEMQQQGIDPSMPVVIILNCVRKAVNEAHPTVFLQRKLSEVEKQGFQRKKMELCKKYKSQNEQFHGFNIMQTDFSSDYVQEACSILKDKENKKGPRKNKLISFLSLLNTYVPGSYLLECQCQEYLGQPRQDLIRGGPSFAERMAPFGHLFVLFHQKKGPKYETVVRMAHPMMAEQCIQLFVEAGEKRSQIATMFLTDFCNDPAPSYLVPFVKDMLTKREKKVGQTPMTGKDGTVKVKTSVKEKFSALILCIDKDESPKSCVDVLKTASSLFCKDAFFPQALARFYYLADYSRGGDRAEMANYLNGESWAKTAKMRAPNNSFVADTLGQVYKHHLNRKISSSRSIPLRELLDLAAKGFNAFEEEERLSEKEQETNLEDDVRINISNHFNVLGHVGYVKIANMIYDKLVSVDQTWSDALTKKASNKDLESLLQANKLLDYKALINSLRSGVERRYAFLQAFLTYSKPYDHNDPTYISSDAVSCYLKYVGTSAPSYVKQQTSIVIQQLKQNRATTSPELFTCLHRMCTEEDLTQIKKWWIEVFPTGQTDQVARSDECILKDVLHNYILANIMLHHVPSRYPDPTSLQQLTDLVREKNQKVLGSQAPREAAELYMLLCLLLWPSGEEKNQSHDISKLILLMANSYENDYKKYLRARYLCPLLFLGKGEGLGKVVPRRILENQVEDERSEEGLINDQMFKDPRVESLLCKVHGVVQNHRVYVHVVGKKLEVGANHPASIWRSGPVSFYVGFNIQGPLACGIQYIDPRPTEEAA